MSCVTNDMHPFIAPRPASLRQDNIFPYLAAWPLPSRLLRCGDIAYIPIGFDGFALSSTRRARSASWCRRRCWLASGPRGILQHPTKGKPVQSCRLHRRAMAGQTNSFIGRPHQAFGLSRWRCGGTIWSVPCASRHRRAFGQPRLPSCLPREPMSWQAQHAP
jgi:hypothetical protein